MDILSDFSILQGKKGVLVMWFWAIAGIVLLTIVSKAAQEARQEQRDKRKEKHLEEINEKLDEDDKGDFLENYGDK